MKGIIKQSSNNYKDIWYVVLNTHIFVFWKIKNSEKYCTAKEN